MNGARTVTHVLTDEAPAPAGHYTQAIVSRGQVYVSGQLPIRPDGLPLEDSGFDAQAEQAVRNLLAVLKAAGCGPEDLVKVTAYIVGVGHWPRFNAVYGALLGDARPARSVVPVPELHHGYLVEIDAVAVQPHAAA